MKHDAHYQCYRIHCAKLSLGTRYILHKQHSGGISHNPSSVNVLKTIKRVEREAKAKVKTVIVNNVARLQIGGAK